MTMRTTARWLAGACLVALVVPAAHAVAPAAAPGDLEIPVRGQAMTLGTNADGEPAVVTVHRVARTEDATILYWSMGLPEGAGDGGRFLGPSSTSFLDRQTGPRQGDVALVDAEGEQVHLPLVPTERLTPCICSAQSAVYSLEPGQAAVLWAALSPLPDDVETVDVVVAEQVIPDVPVEDGLLEPLAEEQRDPIILGMGWPEIDPDLLAEAEAQDPAAYPVTTRVSNLDESVTTSTGQVDLSADVLFAKDSARLTGRATATIREAAQQVRDAGGATSLTVVGHTDSDASASYNKDLSERRAEAVATVLRRQLGGDYRIRTVGRGESEPIADNETAAGKAKNRRVSITFGGGN